MTPLTVLLVDDERHAVDGLSRALRTQCRGWKVITATSGIDALMLLASERVDVVVSDIHMPGMDGVELTREILVRFPWVIRIMFSGVVDPDQLQVATRWSERHLIKPVAIDVLVDEIVAAVRRRDVDRKQPLPENKSIVHPVVLVVEDNPEDVELIRQALKEINSDVDLRHVSKAEAALAWLAPAADDSKSPRAHVIVLDLHLPGMSGYEFLSHYRAKDGPHVPVVAVSGAGKPQAQAEAIRHGAARFIDKPTTWDRYIEVARNLTQYARLCADATTANP